MFRESFAGYQISFFDKQDGNPKDPQHPAQEYFSTSQTHGIGIYSLLDPRVGYAREVEADAIFAKK
ncbi:MAG: hypothetical protein H6765_05280 [Candidatus Peribacteria bacterium]|nr:MAG: hypothetical protein H6765_05280 [Candidatus Peribacteria bacterium]